MLKNTQYAIMAIIAFQAPVYAQAIQQYIPSSLQRCAGEGNLRKQHQSGKLTCYSLDKKLTINWTASGLENLQPDWSLFWDPTGEPILGTHRVTTTTQEFVVDFHPTAACVISNDAILVGGINEAQETIIQRWDLVWPDSMPVLKVDPNTGISQVGVAMVNCSVKKVIYKDTVAGRNLVRDLCWIRKADTRNTCSLVQFDDSGDLYSLEMYTGALQLLSTHEDASGTLGMISGLVGPTQRSVAYRDHATVGYTYTLSRLDRSGRHLSVDLAGIPSYVILVDNNRDGTIDTYLELNGAEYISQGWRDMGSYLNPWTY